jgi:hypothetical protein
MRRARAGPPRPPPAVESAGPWKAPGHRPCTPGPSHTPWKSWAPALHPQDSHSYTQPRRRGQLKEQRR